MFDNLRGSGSSGPDDHDPVECPSCGSTNVYQTSDRKAECDDCGSEFRNSPFQ